VLRQSNECGPVLAMDPKCRSLGFRLAWRRGLGGGSLRGGSGGVPRRRVFARWPRRLVGGRIRRRRGRRRPGPEWAAR